MADVDLYQIMIGDLSFDGVINGTVTYVKKGNNGFGYDPIFLPVNRKKTFAQMSRKEKGMISHRGIATRKLIKHLRRL